MNLVDDIFNRVVFDQDDRDYHTKLYNKIKHIASEVDSICPECADKALAFRAFHLGLMHVGAALSKQEKYK